MEVLPTERMTHSDSPGRNGCAPSARAESNRKRLRNITGCRSVPGIRPEVHPNAGGSRAPLGIRCARVGVLAGGSNHGEDLRDEKVSLFDSGRRGGGLRLRSILRAPQLYPKTLSSQATAVAEP